MYIRRTQPDDLPAVMTCFTHAKQIMRASGNLHQWSGDYPSQQDVLADMDCQQSYVCLSDQQEHDLEPDTILATFCLMQEPDPNYLKIDGQWLDQQAYVTIHRIASNGLIQGVGQACIRWAMDHYRNVRIDTHEDNQLMQHILTKLGFHFCGYIQLADGASRRAYHYVKK
ncbi:GNAT family N-acetyltransferase [Vaginisenegalia massiliensis]|uniref:GNAT family N-acetyltransferase n=1 Tax=Vaginisenegalia massiliensis TaxID=2058294 RepID=UPI000F522209|nr:GNAT family N-acetyltransferase [Vaginisenegalia massiliensis]